MDYDITFSSDPRFEQAIMEICYKDVIFVIISAQHGYRMQFYLPGELVQPIPAASLFDAMIAGFSRYIDEEIVVIHSRIDEAWSSIKVTDNELSGSDSSLNIKLVKEDSLSKISISADQSKWYEIYDFLAILQYGMGEEGEIHKSEINTKT